ncbi:fimbrial biogenesis outer membrane usher protein [Enterobacteriaceae bacterium 89]|nr:fimbrial biogenesis outer membrane usher protein [Enterobacteriaceae bacterium 89]
MQKKYLAEIITAARSASWIYAFVLTTPALFPMNVFASEKSDGKDVEFNTSFLDTGYTGHVDLKQFSQGGGMLAGQYLADVYLNDVLVASEKITFSKLDNGMVAACLFPELLAQLNVKPEALSIPGALSAEKCTPVEKVIPSARVKFDSGRQALLIGVPQQDMQTTARGSVSPTLWQSGSAAAFTSYNANTYQTRTQGKTFESQYLSLNTGVNVGEWYFRHNGSLTRQTEQKGTYQNLNSYVQHDISAIRGRFLAGQANTLGRLFDTVPYTGVSVFSDDKMLPESQRGYAPEIRGIARSNARVTVRQGESIIYETTVPAGAFVINDLYPTGYGGDLNVTVREADGSEKAFLVPYASVVDLLRPGAHRYEAVAGKYRAQHGKDGQPFYQASWQQGLTNILSLYGGVQFSEGYQAYQLGSAVSTPLGALAFDVTQADTRTVNDRLSGQSYKMTYNKLISDTQSNIALAAYRFSTKDYLDFSQAMQYQNYQSSDPVFAGLLYRAKNRYSLTLSQGLPEGWGTLYTSGLSQSYWNRSGSDMQYQLGYSNNWRSLTYSIAANRNRSLKGEMETSWQLSFSMPLGERRPLTFSSGFSRDANGNMGRQASLSGTAGEQQQLSWGLSGTQEGQTGSTGSVSGQYLSPWTSVNGSFATGRDTNTFSAGLTGSVVAHPHGVTLTPYTSDTWVVVHAPGAAGADVTSYPGLKLDHWGNAVLPAPSTYQRNVVNIDPKKLPDDVELQSTTQSVVPRAGSVVVAEYTTREGQAMLLMPSDEAQALPFGTNVTDSAGNNVGITGQGGMLYVRVTDKTGKLFATTNNNDKPQTCIIPYRLSEMKQALQRTTYSCQQGKKE